MSDGRLTEEDFDGICERAEAINGVEEAEPFVQWAHRVDQWHASDLPRLVAGFKAEREFAEKLQEQNTALLRLFEQGYRAQFRILTQLQQFARQVDAEDVLKKANEGGTEREGEG